MLTHLYQSENCCYLKVALNSVTKWNMKMRRNIQKFQVAFQSSHCKIIGATLIAQFEAQTQFVYRFIVLSYICVDLHDIACQMALSLNPIASIYIVKFCHINFARQTDKFRKYRLWTLNKYISYSSFIDYTNTSSRNVCIW